MILKPNYICIIITLLFTACKPLKEASVPVEKTAFYTFSIEKDTTKNQLLCKVLNTQVVDTKINYQINKAKEKEPYYLRLDVLDKSHQQISALVDHPLYKRFDLYAESGEIESKSISLQQAEFVVRLPYFSEFKSITITETINFVKQKSVVIKNEN